MDFSLIIYNQDILKKLIKLHALNEYMGARQILVEYKAIQCSTCLSTKTYLDWMNWLIETNADAKKFYQDVHLHVQ